MTLEQAAEAVLRAVPDGDVLYMELRYWYEEERAAILSTLRTFAEQVAREALGAADREITICSAISHAKRIIRALDPAKIVDEMK